jgi:hypothetical protein
VDIVSAVAPAPASEETALEPVPAISGNVPQKRGRGRPRVIPAEATRRGLFDGMKPRDAQEEFYYATILATIWPVGLEPWERERRFEYLWNAGRPHRTILTALGRLRDRIRDDETVRTIAEQICDNRTPARIAVPRLRAWRIGRDVRCRPVGLTNALLAAVSDYKRAFPALTEREVERAFMSVLIALGDGNVTGDREQLAAMAR